MSTSHGVLWAPLLPEHWRRARLRWLASIYAGGTPDRENPEYWRDGTIPWLNSGSVNDWAIHKPSEMISQAGFGGSSARWVPAGAVVIGLAGQGKTKGTAARLEIEATTNQSMAAIVPGAELDYRYLHYWLASNYRSIRHLAGGDKRDGLNLQHVGGIECPLPPLSEQAAIADYLDHETAQIDTLIAKQRRLIATLSERRLASIKAATISAGHRALPLRRAARLLNGGTPSSNPENWNGDIPFATPPDLRVSNGTTVESTTRSLTCRGVASGSAIAPMNAILLSIRAPIGYVSRLMLPMAFNQGCRAIITSRSLLPEFLVYALLALREELEAAGRGTTFMELSAAQTASLEVPVPPVEEQRRIVQRLDEQTATVDTLIAKAERFIELSKERRAALITAAVTGQLQIPA